jgi:hypothetical protein
MRESEKVERKLRWRVQESQEEVLMVETILVEPEDIKSREDMIPFGISSSIARVLLDYPLH